jgi:hypothetical protein
MVKIIRIGQSAAKLGNDVPATSWHLPFGQWCKAPVSHPRRFRDYMVTGDENCKIFRAQDIVQSYKETYEYIANENL